MTVRVDGTFRAHNLPAGPACPNGGRSWISQFSRPTPPGPRPRGQRPVIEL